MAAAQATTMRPTTRKVPSVGQDKRCVAAMTRVYGCVTLLMDR
jgi:hypothetical protein